MADKEPAPPPSRVGKQNPLLLQLLENVNTGDELLHNALLVTITIAQQISTIGVNINSGGSLNLMWRRDHFRVTKAIALVFLDL